MPPSVEQIVQMVEQAARMAGAPSVTSLWWAPAHAVEGTPAPRPDGTTTVSSPSLVTPLASFLIPVVGRLRPGQSLVVRAVALDLEGRLFLTHDVQAPARDARDAEDDARFEALLAAAAGGDAPKRPGLLARLFGLAAGVRVEVQAKPHRWWRRPEHTLAKASRVSRSANVEASRLDWTVEVSLPKQALVPRPIVQAGGGEPFTPRA